MADKSRAASWDEHRRAVMKSLIEKIVADPDFRNELAKNPEKAMASVGFDEPLRESKGKDPVAMCSYSCPKSCGYTCMKTGIRKPKPL